MDKPMLSCTTCDYTLPKEHVKKYLISHCPVCFEPCKNFQDAIDEIDGVTHHNWPGRAE